MKKYTSKKYTDEKAQMYGEYLDALAKKHGGTLTPKQVVDSARNPKSLIHNLFDWDNDEAAEKYRLFQARMFVNQIDVEITVEGRQEPLSVACRVSVKDENNERKYIDTEVAMQDDIMRETILNNCLRDLNNWNKKYKKLQELADAMENIQPEVSKIRKKILGT